MSFSSLGGVLPPRANNDGRTFGTTMRMSHPVSVPPTRRRPCASSSSSFSFKRGRVVHATTTTRRRSNYGCGLFFNRVGSFSSKRSKNHASSLFSTARKSPLLLFRDSSSLSLYSTTSSNTATAAFGSFPNRRRLSFISKAQDDEE